MRSIGNAFFVFSLLWSPAFTTSYSAESLGSVYENESTAYEALNHYAAAQSFYSNATGKNNDQKAPRYADNFRNLHYDREKDGGKVDLIVKKMADAYYSAASATPTIETEEKPGAQSPYMGYYFVEDPAITDWNREFALYAIPASPEAGDHILWIDNQKTVFKQRVDKDAISQGIGVANLSSPRVTTAAWKRDSLWDKPRPTSPPFLERYKKKYNLVW